MVLCKQVRILSLDPEDMMSALAVQMVNAVPESLLFIDSPAADIAGKGEDAAGAGGLFLNIGAHHIRMTPVPTSMCMAIVRESFTTAHHAVSYSASRG